MPNTIEKKDYYNFLYTYYQNLFTTKQKEVFESYYFEDYSLSEISESLGVSRNAVWDVLKKVEHNLDEYESKLGLYQKNKVLETYLNELMSYTTEEGKAIIHQIKEME